MLKENYLQAQTLNTKNSFSRNSRGNQTTVLPLTGHVVRMPFYCATENMAALLRSARLLKFSPSGLLQITGTKRNGPPLSRLYSGALGGTGTGVCPRNISPAAGNASRYHAAC